MLSKELLDVVGRYISDDKREVLKESYSSVKEALTDLYLVGVELQSGSQGMTLAYLQDLHNRISREYGLNDKEDYELIDFLVCFELGFNDKVAPVVRERQKLKMVFGGLIFAAHRFAGIPPVRAAKTIVTEADICQELSVAQEARWQLDFRKCFGILDTLENCIKGSPLSWVSKQYWSANVSDLKVEALFTTSNIANHGRAVALADAVVNDWGKQRNYVKLAHSYLRKAVLYRQRAFLDATPKPSLVSCLDTMLEAEEEVTKRLAAQKDQEAIRTLFSLYIELAKAHAQTGMISQAWRFFHYADKQFNFVADLSARRYLDLVRAKAVILAEQNRVRDFYEINKVEECIDEMQQAIDTAERRFANDLVLREILTKDLIPLLASLGNSGKASCKEAAQNLLRDSWQTARQLKLFHQMRGLNFIAAKYSLHLEE